MLTSTLIDVGSLWAPEALRVLLAQIMVDYDVVWNGLGYFHDVLRVFRDVLKLEGAVFLLIFAVVDESCLFNDHFSAVDLRATRVLLTIVKTRCSFLQKSDVRLTLELEPHSPFKGAGLICALASNKKS
ncbi:hypothetical protein NPIL_569251 [Nephila pilipes]|uniref:Uncharacterized protein n=1 Tax=Nephila pilipes TaxID=299642 RepID=A0A8X6PNV2_NEPPI|nr:hypothetical protein NPIL_569251 [Nephila pilipes]